MNDGVKILLERMKTNPEEFIDFPKEKHIISKWGEVISDYESYLEPEDLQALKNGLKAIHQQHFTEKVLEKLVNPDRKLTREEKISLGHIPAIKSVPFNMVDHIDAHNKVLGLTPIAGVTQTL
jgi:hypothetical protein